MNRSFRWGDPTETFIDPLLPLEPAPVRRSVYMLPLERPAETNFITSFRKPSTLSNLTKKNCNIYSKNTRSTKVTAVLTTNTPHRTLSYECDNKNGRRKSNSNHSFLFPPLYFRFVLTFFLKTIA